MLISLHKQAATTPKIRAAIQASTEPAWRVAERYGISMQTVWKWQSRNSMHDRSDTSHRLQSTLTPAQEAVALALRKSLLLPLDDLLSVVREFLNPHVSRSGLDRCLRRHGVGNLRALKPALPRPAHGAFKTYEPGYLHVDVKYLPQMADESRRRYLFVAIDRATRWVFVRIYPDKTAANARRFLRDLERAAPMTITRVLTDNGKEFTDRLFGLRRRGPTATTISTASAPPSVSSIAWPRRCTRKPMVWSNASMAGSRTSCRATASAAARISNRPSCAMSDYTTVSSRNQC